MATEGNDTGTGKKKQIWNTFGKDLERGLVHIGRGAGEIPQHLLVLLQLLGLGSSELFLLTKVADQLFSCALNTPDERRNGNLRGRWKRKCAHSHFC